jgi:hypothetical protein
MVCRDARLPLVYVTWLVHAGSRVHGALLHHMRQLVREQSAPARRLGRVLPGSKDDMAVDSQCMSVSRTCSSRRRYARVDPHVTHLWTKRIAQGRRRSG